MPKARTATIATSRVRIAGWYDAFTISQPAVAVRATPDADARPPRRVGSSRPWRRSSTGSSPVARSRGDARQARARDRTGARGSVTYLVGEVRQRGLWATTTTEDGAAGPTTVSAMICSVAARGGRLVEQHRRSLGQHHAGQREVGPLAGRERRTVLAEHGVEPGRQGDPASSATRGACPGPPSDASGTASRRLSATVPRRRPGLRQPGDPVAGRAVDGARGRLEQPGQHGEQRRLAAAGRPGDRGDATLGQGEADVVEGGHGAAGPQHRSRGRAASAPGRRCGVVSSASTRSLAASKVATPSARGVELGAHPAQRPVGLGRQEQHDQRGLEVQVAVREPDADGDRDQRDRQRRRPARAPPTTRTRSAASAGSGAGSGR